MRGPAQAVAVFTIMLLLVIAGALHVPSWALLFGAAALALVSVLNHPMTRPLLGLHDGSAARVLVLSSTLNATAVSAGAFMVGNLIGWAWGV